MPLGPMDELLAHQTAETFDRGTGEVRNGPLENLCVGCYPPHGFETAASVAP